MIKTRSNAEEEKLQNQMFHSYTIIETFMPMRPLPKQFRPPTKNGNEYIKWH